MGERPVDPDDESSEWFDLTGSPVPLDRFQHGIGKDQIPAIDDPVFVKPDDPRLRELWTRLGIPLKDLPVIGYVHKDDSRAYPIPILDRHELVNDTIGGKPVTVGY